MHHLSPRRNTDVVVGLDADDLLWHNEDLFAEVEQRFRDLVTPWADAPAADQALVRQQRARVQRYGFGAKAFALAMIQAACDLSANTITANDVSTIVAWGDELLTAPTILIDGVAEAVEQLHRQHDLYIFTKGDLHRQLERVGESGMAKWCVDVEVLAQKDPATYRRLLRRHALPVERFVMIGNSLVSDVFPVVEIGARAIHVPYEVTWALEQPDPADAPDDSNERWRRAATLVDACELISQLPWTPTLDQATP